MQIWGAAVVSFSSCKGRENCDTGLLATLCLEYQLPSALKEEEIAWSRCLQTSPHPTSPTLLMSEFLASPRCMHTVYPLS